jgi:peptidyl-prolyl cis-trans isomerase A (cyclophilin A)
VKSLFLAILLSMAVWAQPTYLTPLPQFKDRAPALTQVTKVRFVTTQGNILMELYPQAAPNAVARFTELVQKGFYDFTPVFRVVPNFVAQFGINWRGTFPEYQNNNFKDDPSYFALGPGTLAFAKAGPDTNSTQIFINYQDNSRLVQQGNFTAFGKVVEGLDIALSFPAVGDPSMGLDQDQLWGKGDAYLKKLPKQPAYILFAEVLP